MGRILGRNAEGEGAGGRDGNKHAMSSCAVLGSKQKMS